MASDEIKYSDLVQPGTFEKLKADGEALVVVFKDLEKVIKATMSSTKGSLMSAIVTSSDAERTQKVIQTVTELDNELKKAVDTRTKLEKENEKLRLSEIALQKARENAFDNYEKKLQKELQLKEKAKIAEENLQKAKESAMQKERLSEIALQQAREKAFDNYERQLKKKEEAEKKAQKAAEWASREYIKQSKILNDLRNEFKDVALAQGINSKAAQDLLAKITPLDAKLKQVDATVGQHQRNVGNYVGTLSQMKTGLLEIGSALGLAFGVGEVINFGKESIKAFVEAEKNAHDLEFAIRNIGGEGGSALNKLLEQSAKLQENSIFSDDDIQRAQTALVQYGLTSKQVEELVPNILNLATAQGEDLATATDKVIKAIGGQTKGLKTAGIAFEDTGSKTENLALVTEKLSKFQGASAAALETTEGKARRLENAFGDFQETVGEFLVNEGARFLDFFDNWNEKGLMGALSETAVKGATETWVNGFKEANKQLLEDAEKGDKERLAAVKTLQSQIIQLTKAYAKAEDLEQKQIIANVAYNQRLVLNELLNTAEKRTKILDDSTKDDSDKKDKEAKKDLERQKKLYEEQLKSEKWLEDEKIKAAHKQNKAEMQAQRDADDIIKQMMDEQLQSELDAWERAKKIQEDKDKQAEEDKKHRAEEVADSIDTVEKLEQIYFNYYQRINELKRESIENDLDATNKNIEIQAQLAARGLENTLGYEMEKKNQLEKARAEQIEREKKQAQQQEAAQLALAFIKAYENYIGKNMSSGQALSKAATDVLAAKLLSKAIAGAFADGVENFKGDGTGTSDSNLIAFSNGESVVTAKATSETPGLVSALNEKGKLGALEWAMDNVYKPNYNSLGLADVSTKRQTESALMSVLVHELNELKEVVKNKKETTLELDNMGNVIKTTVENGVRKTVKKKTHLS